MQEYFEVRSWTLLVLSLFLTGFLVSLFFIEWNNEGAVFIIDGKSILKESNFSTIAKVGNERTLKIFFVQIFSNLSWRLLLNESFQFPETKSNEINFLIRAVNENSLEILTNKNECFAVIKVENVKQSSFLFFVTYDSERFVEK
ncbi:MAG: hypothetical protein QXS21_02345 [Thermoproteota archaeon]|nr:hypothetical protein [Candidatus Brockarchaeota archaeon]MBO3801378.1 hypothetical protein [Candidatus Brockarchaeota archaeon]